MVKLLKNRAIWLVFFFLLFPILFSFAVNAQENFKIENLTSNDGLSHNSVRKVFQDSKGFIWIGTEGGLNKYDGYDITEYVNNPEDPYSISDNWISAIYEDPADSGKILWIGTKKGLNKFDRETGLFKIYNINQSDSNKSTHYWIHCIYKKQGDIFLIGGNGLKSLDKVTGEVKTYLAEFKDLYVYSIYKDRSGDYLIGSNLGLFQLSPEIKNKDFIYRKNSSKSLQVLSIYEGKNGKLWIGTDSGFYIYLKDERKIIRPKFNFGDSRNEIVFSIFEDHKGNLLATSRNALLIINNKRDSLNIFKKLMDDLPNPYSRGNNRPYDQNVISGFIDKTDIIWLSTSWNGVYKFVPDRKNFKLFRHDPNDNYSLGSSWVTSFCEDKDGHSYVGTIGGNLNQFDKKTDRFLRIDLSIDNYCIREGLDNDIWYTNYYSLINFNFNDMISTAYFGNGISSTLKFNISQNNSDNDALRQHLWNYLFANFDLSQIKDYPTIDYLYVSKAGIIWCVLVMNNGKSRILHTFDKITKCFIPHEIYANELVSNYITNIYEDSKGIIWFGTDGKGLIKRVKKYDETNNKHFDFIQYQNNINDANSISDNTLTSISEDENGFLWIGTNNGLNKFNVQKEIFTQFGVKDGLPSKLIAGILIDNEGYIWVSSNKGLSKFDPKSEKFNNYDVKDGLQSNNFSIGANYKAKNGDMYFGGPNGFNLFSPQDIEENTLPPKVVINRFTLFNELIKPGKDSPLKKNIELCNEIKLDYDQDIFGFEFVALDFTDPMKNLYAYKMAGVNPDWIFTDARKHFATYTKLQPGEYTFKVKASNNDGFWNEDGSSIRIIILPPWWRTTWAYLIYTVFIIFILTNLYFLQKKRLGLRHELEMKNFETLKLQELDKIKSKFFASISHEFRTPLTLIKGPVEHLLSGGKIEDPKKMYRIIKRNSERLLNLINELLDLSKLESGKMKLNAQKSNIVSFIKGIVMLFESLAQKKKIQIIINSSETNIDLYFDKEKMQKIIANLLSNAFKFTPEKGKIILEIKKKSKDQTVAIIVSDNGIGISEKELPNIFNRFYQVVKSETEGHEGTGIGLSLTKELIEVHHGTIEAASEEGKGTTFRLNFPLGRKHLREDEIIYEEKVKAKPIKVAGEDLEIESSLTEKPILLIVEDNKDVRDFIKSIIEKKYKIIEAEDGDEGFSKAKELIPDLIISDIMMPKLTGDRMCEKLKTDLFTSHIPIILLTAKATDEAKLDGLEAGADDYLIKPFNEKELVVRINNLIAQRHKLREKYLREAEIHPAEVAVTSADKKFIENVIKLVEENMQHSEFNIEQFAEELAMSRAQLFRKFISILGEKPSEFVRKYRVKRAAELIEKHFGNIAQIAFEVGFNNLSYFSKCFKTLYKVSPHEYQKKIKK